MFSLRLSVAAIALSAAVSSPAFAETIDLNYSAAGQAAGTVQVAEIPGVPDLGMQAYGVGLKVGTLGIGAEAGAKITDKFGFRVNGNGFNYDHSDEIEGIDFDAELKMRSVGLIGDFHPFSGGFRLSGGVYYNDMGVTLDSTVTDSVEIAGTTYTGTGTLHGEVETNKVAPYIGIGYEAELFSGLTLGVDLGAMYIGKPKVKLAVGGDLAGQVDMADVEKERRDIEDALKVAQFYPVASIGLKYRF
jgi:hypothetical protein